MKKFVRGIILSAAIIVIAAWNASAVPLPVLDYSGLYNYRVSTGVLSSGSFVDSVTYTDYTFTISDTATEQIIGADVNITTGAFVGYDAGGNAVFGDGTFSITDASGTYLTADLIDIVVVQNGAPGSGTVNQQFLANLNNVVLNTALTSRFIDELEPFVIATGGLASTRISLDILGPYVDFSAGDSVGNVQGKLAPVPEPGTLVLLGSGLIGLRLLNRRIRRKK